MIMILFLMLGSTEVESPRTWRLDYFVTYGPNTAIYALDRVLEEPLSWPSAEKSYLDGLAYGSDGYIVKTETGEPWFSRGCSRVSTEWTITGDARLKHRTFHESIRFPEPSSKVTIDVLRRNEENQFVTAHTFHVDPSDPLIDRSQSQTHEAIAFQVNGPPREKVDLLLMADGYSKNEEAKFRADAKRIIKGFFSYEPFKSQQTRFNVWGIFEPSQHSGISRPSTGIHHDTALGCSYDAFGSERYVLTFENRAWRNLAAQAPYEFVVMLVNNETYGGGGMFSVYATLSVDNSEADYLMIHEFGHHFAGLADEYYTSPVSYEAPAVIIEPWEANATALLDSKNVKWRDKVDTSTPIPTPWPKSEFETHAREIQGERQAIRSANGAEHLMSSLFQKQRLFEMDLLSNSPFSSKVGAFQGANYDSQSFYRPQVDCIMFTRDPVPFCRVCAHTLQGVIDWLSTPAQQPPQ